MLFLVVVVGLCGGAAALDNGAGLRPPMGWSSWCTEGSCGRDYCDEGEVQSVATAMIDNGMHALGWNYIVLDDCWANPRDPVTDALTWDAGRFPSGMPALAQWLHDRNFSFGLYTSAGNRTCSSGGRPYPIPGSEGHYQQDMDTFASWNIDLVKVDWCGDVKDRIWEGKRDYLAVSKAFVNATPKRTMYLIGVAAFLFLDGEVGEYYNSWRAWTDHHDNWQTTLNTIEAQETIGVKGKPGAWPDMDILTTGGQGCDSAPNSSMHCPQQTDAEYTTEIAMWAINQSPLWVGTDVRNMTAIMTKTLLNAEIFQIHQDTRTPPGKFVGRTKCGGLDICQLWTRELFDGSVMVNLLNIANNSHTLTFDFTLVPTWTNATTAVVRDVWESNILGKSTGFFSAEVPAHGTGVFRLFPSTDN